MTWVIAGSDTDHIHNQMHEDNHDHQAFPSYYFASEETSLLEN